MANDRASVNRGFPKLTIALGSTVGGVISVALIAGGINQGRQYAATYIIGGAILVVGVIVGGIFGITWGAGVWLGGRLADRSELSPRATNLLICATAFASSLVGAGVFVAPAVNAVAGGYWSNLPETRYLFLVIGCAALAGIASLPFSIRRCSL